MLLSAFTAMAQSRLISGAINDRDTKEVITQATVQLLKMDSTYVDGALTNEEGLFRVHAPENGKYLLKITSVGYKPVIKRIQISEDKDLAMGRLVLGSDAVMLKGAVITAQAQKVVLKEDTFVYNSAAYRTPEGSTIEELVKRLPGAEVSDDGTIKINGKEVKKIRVNGKEFMTGDTKTALKNLPTSIVDKIKAYDIDEVAVRSAKKNLALNPAAKDVEIGVNSLLDGIHDQDADLIVANILAEIILPLIPQAYENLTRAICDIMSKDAGVDGKYCYVKFSEVEHWGFDGSLF